MTTPHPEPKDAERQDDAPLRLADDIDFPPGHHGYALPFFTRDRVETELLISNPNATPLAGNLWLYGPECKVVEHFGFELEPNCTKSFRIRPVVPDHAGHVILSTSQPVVAHLLYHLEREMILLGGELAGSDNLFQWRIVEQSRTYGFGYRTAPLRRDKLAGLVCVSNPNSMPMTGRIVYFDEKCEKRDVHEIKLEPGCTGEYPFPAGTYGYGRIEVSAQATINVLHISSLTKTLAAAELLGEANRLDGPSEPPEPGSRILFDDTHGCRPGVTGDWTAYEGALVAAGYPVDHFTGPAVTLAALQQHDVFVVGMPRAYYAGAEKQALVDFVNAGGGLMIVQDFGLAPPTPQTPWSGPGRDLLNLFGANDDNNIVTDPVHYDQTGWGGTAAVLFDAQRNGRPHPIVNGWQTFRADAICSLSGGTGWTTIVESDDDSTPLRRPVLMGSTTGAGRILAFGDSNVWADYLIGAHENKTFGIRCAEWLLRQI
jgi:hypothetical protein